MSESPYPDGTPEFVTRTIEDSFTIAEQKMGDLRIDSNFARGYWMALIDLRNALIGAKMDEDERREKRRLEAVAALQKGLSGEPS